MKRSSRRRTQRSPAEVRSRLYRIALRRFRDAGFEATPVSAITRESDVAKGTFFNHFPSKEHILARALDEMLDRALGAANRDGTGPDAIVGGLDNLALELAGDPALAGAIVPRLGMLPAPPSPVANPDDETPASPVHGPERLRRWLRDRLAESLRLAVPLEETDDLTLSVLLVSTFEATLREWVSTTGGEPPFPRRLLHGRIAYILAAAGFPRPDLRSS
jgi:AcrR family transcriptional regulator